MKKLLLLLLSLGYIGSAGAVSSLDDYYTSVCVGEKSTGFNWENYDWKKVNFIPEKYIAQKVDATEDSFSFCFDTKNRFDAYLLWGEKSIPTLITYGCYEIKGFGVDRGIPRDCEEKWTTYPKEDEEINPKTRNLESVSCYSEDFLFAPNGWFYRSHIHSDLEATDDKKDSLTVTVGKCSTL